MKISLPRSILFVVIALLTVFVITLSSLLFFMQQQFDSQDSSSSSSVSQINSKKLRSAQISSSQISSIASQSNTISSLSSSQRSIPASSSQSSQTPTFTSPKGVSLTLQSKQNTLCPLEIRGSITGAWFFEASFPIDLVKTSDNSPITTIIAQTSEEWTTENDVSFTASYNCISECDTEITAILKKDNPSGLPSLDDQISVPLTLASCDIATTSFDVFFTTDSSGDTCTEVFAVKRTIPMTLGVARASLTELITGPNPTEISSGYSSIIPQNVKIQSISISNGTAIVDFSQELNTIAGSCAVTLARAQIEQTLMQFDTINSVVISVEGNIDEALQP